MARVGAGVRTCGLQAVLCFLVLSRQACRPGVCFLHVGNGAEPQAGPGLMEGWRGSEAHCHQFLVTNCM